jgi:putative solute:sodium symporter small subunit
MNHYNFIVNLLDNLRCLVKILKESRMSPEKAQAYWKENISMIIKLLVVWFVVSFGCGILFINELNAIEISGVKLGYWFAQQGAIYVFVILIFVYVKVMTGIDEKYGVNE